MSLLLDAVSTLIAGVGRFTLQELRVEMFVPSMRPLLNWRVDALAASDDAALAPPRIECTLIWLQHAEGGETL